MSDIAPSGELGARAVAAAVAVAGAHGVRSVAPLVLADRSNLLVHLRPAPVVARVATMAALVRPRPREALERELAVAGFLARRGAAVVPPSDELPPGPHERDGLALSFWTYVEHDRDAAPDPVAIGRSLAELHRVLRDYAGALPYLGPVLDEVAGGLDRLEPRGELTTETIASLRSAFERIGAALRDTEGDVQALHGDAHAGNLLATKDGLVWMDFEDTCTGSIAWDLACLARKSPLAQVRIGFGDEPADAELALYRETRELQATIWLTVLAQRGAEDPGRARDQLRRWLSVRA